MNFKSLISLFCLAIVTQLPTFVHAEVVIHGTRIIYPADTRETVVQVSNNSNMPSLVQVWVDEGDSRNDPENSNAPFVVLPALSRVDAEQTQAFRVLALPRASELSQTQETLYWLNVLDIPSKPKLEEDASDPVNYLQIAIRSRIKFFYRPSSIENQVGLAAEKIEWKKQNDQILVKNPTPFYLTIKQINQTVDKINTPIFPEGLMLAPFSEQSINLPTNYFDNLSYIIINDYGAYAEYNIKF